MTKRRIRLDQILIDRKLFATDNQAQLAIRSGHVIVNSSVVDKPGILISPEASILVKQKPPYVSRGGLKLAAAIKAFTIDINNKIALDIGSSTGGFTDCLLQHGAAKVYAVDVGYGQLSLALRNNPRVILMERTNARYLKPENFSEKPQLVTIDVSFISLKNILPAISTLSNAELDIIALIKPQFEADRKYIKKGVVQDPAVHKEVIAKIKKIAAELQLTPQDTIPSPILGPAGNKEFLIWFKKIA